MKRGRLFFDIYYSLPLRSFWLLRLSCMKKNLWLRLKNIVDANALVILKIDGCHTINNMWQSFSIGQYYSLKHSTNTIMLDMKYFAALQGFIKFFFFLRHKLHKVYMDTYLLRLLSITGNIMFCTKLIERCINDDGNFFYFSMMFEKAIEGGHINLAQLLLSSLHFRKNRCYSMDVLINNVLDNEDYKDVYTYLLKQFIFYDYFHLDGSMFRNIPKGRKDRILLDMQKV